MKMKISENISEYATRLKTVANEMKRNGETLTNVRVMEKLPRSLTRKFDYVVIAIEESKDFSLISIDELVGSLQVHELRMNQNDDTSHSEKALQSKTLITIKMVADMYVEEEIMVAIEVATNADEDAEDNLLTKARETTIISQLAVVEDFEVEEETNFNNEVTNLSFDVILATSMVTSYECKSNLKMKERSQFIAANEDKDVESGIFLTYNGHEKCNKNILYLDTSASNHMFGQKSYSRR